MFTKKVLLVLALIALASMILAGCDSPAQAMAPKTTATAYPPGFVPTRTPMPTATQPTPTPGFWEDNGGWYRKDVVILGPGESFSAYMTVISNTTNSTIRINARALKQLEIAYSCPGLVVLTPSQQEFVSIAQSGNYLISSVSNDAANIGLLQACFASDRSTGIRINDTANSAQMAYGVLLRKTYNDYGIWTKKLGLPEMLCPKGVDCEKTFNDLGNKLGQEGIMTYIIQVN